MAAWPLFTVPGTSEVIVWIHQAQYLGLMTAVTLAASPSAQAPGSGRPSKAYCSHHGAQAAYAR
eukprot:213604-Chlamydomonas_euryale.AAC.40